MGGISTIHLTKYGGSAFLKRQIYIDKLKHVDRKSPTKLKIPRYQDCINVKTSKQHVQDIVCCVELLEV